MIPAARLARVPVVIGSQRQLGDLLTPAKSRAQLVVLRSCDRVVANSRAAADRLVAQGLNAREIAVIGNGLAPASFAMAKALLPRHDSQFRVGMIARMNSPSKNHSLFLKAAALVHRTLPNAEFVLAGDGPLRSELERQAEMLGIRHRVRFLGDCRDTPAVFASLDISVLPSISESLSNAILESMAAGVPVIAVDVGGNSELIAEDRGILLPVADERRLAGAIEQLAREASTRTAFGRNSRIFAESNFTIATIARRYRELYTELLEANAKKRACSRGAQKGMQKPLLGVAIVAASSRYVGGQSVQAEWLTEHWRNDAEVEVTAIQIDPRFPQILRWAESIPVLRTLIRQPLYLWKLWRGQSDADVVHIFSASYWSFLLATAPALLMARLGGKSVVIHYHSGEARDHLRRSHPARALLRCADRLIVPSGYLVEVFREFGLDAEAVPNIVALSQFPFRVRRPLRPHLVCTRGFHPYYRVDLVVRAFAEVKQKYPHAKLDLVGAGPSEAEIRELVKQLGIRDVTFRGVASRRDIGKVYDEADIFINASDLDNMPVSILEAFATGLPVVTTAPEGMEYVVEDQMTGLLSPPGDSHALARNVLGLLGDPELASRIISSARTRSESYQWAAVRGQWLHIYRSLVRREIEAPAKMSAVT